MREILKTEGPTMRKKRAQLCVDNFTYPLIYPQGSSSFEYKSMA